MNFKKLTAILTTACFLYSSVFSSIVQAAVDNTHTIKEFKRILDDSVIPQSAGRVTEYSAGSDDAVVINIQDLHCNAEVQRNIAKVIAAVDEQYPLKKIYIEGASGSVDTAWLTGIKDKDFQKEMTENLVNQGRLTGAEYFSVLTRKPNILAGIEDYRLYKENFVRLNTITQNKERYARIAARLEAELETMKERYYNSQNARFEKLLNEYKTGKMEPKKYYKLLEKYVEKLNSSGYRFGNLSDIDINKFRNIVLYLDLMNQGERLNYKRVNLELQGYMAELKAGLPFAAYNQLLEKTDNFSKLDELYGYLAKISKEYKIEVGVNFPELNKFFSYIEKSKELNPVEMIKEEKQLVSEIHSGLSNDMGELEVAFLSSFFVYFGNYLNNNLTADDYVYFNENFPKFRSLWSKYSSVDSLNSLTKDFQLLDEYYAANIKRNTVFLDNISASSSLAGKTAVAKQPAAQGAAIQSGIEESKLKNALDNAKDIIVVVTGGFHTEGISKLLKQRNIKYFVVTPNITKDTKVSDLIYSELVKHQAKILAQSFAPLPISEEKPAEKLSDLVVAKVLQELSSSNPNIALKDHAEKILSALIGKSPASIEQKLKDDFLSFEKEGLGRVVFQFCKRSADSSNNYLFAFKTSDIDGKNPEELVFMFNSETGAVSYPNDSSSIDQTNTGLSDLETPTLVLPQNENIAKTIRENSTRSKNNRYINWFYNRVLVEFYVGIVIGARELLNTLRPVKFYNAHEKADKAWKNYARMAGITAIWAVMIIAGVYVFGITTNVFTSAAGGVAGNILTHGLYNTIFKSAPLTLGSSLNNLLSGHKREREDALKRAFKLGVETFSFKEKDLSSHKYNEQYSKRIYERFSEEKPNFSKSIGIDDNKTMFLFTGSVARGLARNSDDSDIDIDIIIDDLGADGPAIRKRTEELNQLMQAWIEKCYEKTSVRPSPELAELMALFDKKYGEIGNEKKLGKRVIYLSEIKDIFSLPPEAYESKSKHVMRNILERFVFFKLVGNQEMSKKIKEFFTSYKTFYVVRGMIDEHVVRTDFESLRSQVLILHDAVREGSYSQMLDDYKALKHIVKVYELLIKHYVIANAGRPGDFFGDNVVEEKTENGDGSIKASVKSYETLWDRSLDIMVRENIKPDANGNFQGHFDSIMHIINLQCQGLSQNENQNQIVDNLEKDIKYILSVINEKNIFPDIFSAEEKAIFTLPENKSADIAPTRNVSTAGTEAFPAQSGSKGNALTLDSTYEFGQRFGLSKRATELFLAPFLAIWDFPIHLAMVIADALMGKGLDKSRFFGGLGIIAATVATALLGHSLIAVYLAYALSHFIYNLIAKAAPLTSGEEQPITIKDKNGNEYTLKLKDLKNPEGEEGIKKKISVINAEGKQVGWANYRLTKDKTAKDFGIFFNEGYQGKGLMPGILKQVFKDADIIEGGNVINEQALEEFRQIGEHLKPELEENRKAGIQLPEEAIIKAVMGRTPLASAAIKADTDYEFFVKIDGKQYTLAQFVQLPGIKENIGLSIEFRKKGAELKESAATVEKKGENPRPNFIALKDLGLEVLAIIGLAMFSYFGLDAQTLSKFARNSIKSNFENTQNTGNNNKTSPANIKQEIGDIVYSDGLLDILNMLNQSFEDPKIQLIKSIDLSNSIKYKQAVADANQLMVDKGLFTADEVSGYKVLFLEGFDSESFAVANTSLRIIAISGPAFDRITSDKQAQWLAVRTAHELRHVLNGPKVRSGEMTRLYDEYLAYSENVNVLEAFGADETQIKAQKLVRDAFGMLADPKNTGKVCSLLGIKDEKQFPSLYYKNEPELLGNFVGVTLYNFGKNNSQEKTLWISLEGKWSISDKKPVMRYETFPVKSKPKQNQQKTKENTRKPNFIALKDLGLEVLAIIGLTMFSYFGLDAGSLAYFTTNLAIAILGVTAIGKGVALAVNKTTKLTVDEERQSRNPFARAHGLLHRLLEPLPVLRNLNKFELVVHLLDFFLFPAAVIQIIRKKINSTVSNLKYEARLQQIIMKRRAKARDVVENKSEENILKEIEDSIYANNPDYTQELIRQFLDSPKSHGLGLGELRQLSVYLRYASARDSALITELSKRIEFRLRLFIIHAVEVSGQANKILKGDKEKLALLREALFNYYYADSDYLRSLGIAEDIINAFTELKDRAEKEEERVAFIINYNRGKKQPRDTFKVRDALFNNTEYLNNWLIEAKLDKRWDLARKLEVLDKAGMMDPDKLRAVLQVHFEDRYDINITLHYADDFEDMGITTDKLLTHADLESIKSVMIQIDEELASVPFKFKGYNSNIKEIILENNGRANYSPDGRSITLYVNSSGGIANTLFHELGHSVAGKYFNVPFLYSAKRFRQWADTYGYKLSGSEKKLLDNPDISVSEQASVDEKLDALMHKLITELFKKRQKEYFKSKAEPITAHAYEYTFLVPEYDGGPAVRTDADEFIAEFFKTYVLHPDELARYDREIYDLFEIIFDGRRAAIQTTQPSASLIFAQVNNNSNHGPSLSETGSAKPDGLFTEPVLQNLFGRDVPREYTDEVDKYFKQEHGGTLSVLTDPEKIARIRVRVQEKLKGKYLNARQVTDVIDAVLLKYYKIDIHGMYTKMLLDSMEKHIVHNIMTKIVDSLLCQLMPDDVPVYRSVDAKYAGLPSTLGVNASYWGVGEEGLDTVKGYDANKPGVIIIKSDLGRLRRAGIIIYDYRTINAITLVHSNPSEKVEFDEIGANNGNPGLGLNNTLNVAPLAVILAAAGVFNAPIIAIVDISVLLAVKIFTVLKRKAVSNESTPQAGALAKPDTGVANPAEKSANGKFDARLQKFLDAFNKKKAELFNYNGSLVDGLPETESHATSSALVRNMIFDSDGYITPQKTDNLNAMQGEKFIFLSSLPQNHYGESKAKQVGGRPVVLTFDFTKLKNEGIVIEPGGYSTIVNPVTSERLTYSNWGGYDVAREAIPLRLLTEESKQEVIRALAQDNQDLNWQFSDEELQKIADALGVEVSLVNNIINVIMQQQNQPDISQNPRPIRRPAQSCAFRETKSI